MSSQSGDDSSVDQEGGVRSFTLATHGIPVQRGDEVRMWRANHPQNFLRFSRAAYYESFEENDWASVPSDPEYVRGRGYVVVYSHIPPIDSPRPSPIRASTREEVLGRRRRRAFDEDFFK